MLSPLAEHPEPVTSPLNPTRSKNVREDQLSGATQSIDSQLVCEGRTNKRGSIASNTRRPNNKESPKRKRVYLRPRQLDTHEVNKTILAEHTVSTLVPRPNQELRMSISSKQSTSVATLYQETIVLEAAASQDVQHQRAKQVLDYSSGILQPLGPLQAAKRPACKHGDVNAHTLVALEFVQSNSQCNLRHSAGDTCEEQIP